METTFEKTPEIKTVDQPQQLFVKIFEGTMEQVELQINVWLGENAKKIEIDAQNAFSVLSGNAVIITVIFRFMWINR